MSAGQVDESKAKAPTRRGAGYDAAYAYAQSFASSHRVRKHQRKFTRRIEEIRHRIEVDFLKPRARGALFDCSIGFGRLVPELKNVTSYSAMDYSADFIGYVRNKFPQVRAHRGDLLKGIDEPDNTYDTVICVRTLPPLPGLGRILSDMVRIARPGGTIIFDYGIRPRPTEIDGYPTVSSGYRVNDVLAKLPARLVTAFRKDSVFVRLIKKHRLLNRLFHSRFNLLPDRFYIWLEKILSLATGVDVVYVLRKNQ